MNLLEIEDKMRNVLQYGDKIDFIFNFLEIYDFPKSTISRLKKEIEGDSVNKNQILLKNKFIFKTTTEGEDVHAAIDELSKSISVTKFNPRFVIVTDYKTFLALDLKTRETVDTNFEELPRHYAFFLPWVGIEKAEHVTEKLADIKASYKMAKLYDQIISDNQSFSREYSHDLNIFLSRLLFCFFAEDTSIFAESIFTLFIKSCTKAGGSDLAQNLDVLFEVLNTKDNKDFPEHFSKFPYVNGGLFRNKIKLPVFTKKSWDMIVECSDLNWKEINPDIFGSMIQAVVNPDQRENLGMHYTSVPNIMKVIQPLFLNDLHEEFVKSFDDIKKLERLWHRLGEIQIFDPACGSGNFLIISFKELSKLEIKILERIQQLSGQNILKMGSYSLIKLGQFHGIEIDDFAHEMAILSLWLAQHQMNNAFKDVFGISNPTLPLREGGKIICGNATRLDWDSVCPKTDLNNSPREVYIAGNPPYLGYSLQNQDQKEDLELICLKNKILRYKELDYIACWFIKGADYIKATENKLALVSTNSITQGEQVQMLWPHILSQGVGIFFAYQSFKWKNLARGNAGVTCIIVGLAKSNSNLKALYFNNSVSKVKNINPYLASAPDLIVESESTPLSNLPKMVLGNMAKDGGYLFLDQIAVDELLRKSPEALAYIKKTLGSAEFIRGINSYCLWVEDDQLKDAKKIESVNKIFEKVKSFRLKSVADSTSDYAEYPNRFKQRTHQKGVAIILPRVSSERRDYIPAGFVEDVIIKDSAYGIYNPEPWVFGIITSHMHMVWVRAVAGRLKTDLRYSSSLCYNTFPLPTLTESQKESITNNVFNILSERERWPEKTMAELYDPEKMPEGLREAHVFLDKLVEKIYRDKPFENDEERLAHLFRLYEEMINRDKLIKDESKFTKKKVAKAKK